VEKEGVQGITILCFSWCWIKETLMWVCLLLISFIYDWSTLFCSSNKLGSASVIGIEFGGSLGGFVLGFAWVFSSFTQIFFWIPKIMWCVHYKEIIVVKTRWIDMLFLAKCVMEKYWLQIMKTHVNCAKNNITNENLNLFCDLELIVGLHAICHFGVCACWSSLFNLGMF